MTKNIRKWGAMFLKKKPTVHFRHLQEFDVLKVERSNKFLPQWFKKLDRFHDENVFASATVKTCIPFLEAMSHGYTIPLWCDIVVTVSTHYTAYDASGAELIEMMPICEDADGQPPNVIGQTYGGGVIDRIEPKYLGCVVQTPVGVYTENYGIGRHGNIQVKGMRFPEGAPKTIWKLHSPWFIETPKGYSTFYKNPANNYEHDLRIFEGFVDTDNYSNLAVNFPCFWSGTKKGVFYLKRGTPICQILLMKREEVDLKVENVQPEVVASQQSVLQSKVIDRYRDMFWHKSKGKGKNV